MSKISAHFTREETACKCGECHRYGADIEVVKVLEDLRADARMYWNPDAVINVHSWYRCPKHNRTPVYMGGAGSNDTSWHLTGCAVDFDIPGVDPHTIADHLNTQYPDKYGIGIYEWGVHIDVRPYRARWDETDTGLAA